MPNISEFCSRNHLELAATYQLTISQEGASGIFIEQFKFLDFAVDGHKGEIEVGRDVARPLGYSWHGSFGSS